MALRRPLAVIAGLFRELPAGDAVPIEAGGTGKTTLADAQAALGDLSAIAETTLNGTEQVPVWKGGFLKTTVAKICAWIVGQANIWTAAQRFNGGLLADSVSTAGSGALDLLHTAIFLNKRGSGDRYAHIDLFAAAGAATYNARVLRNPGSNGTLELINTGSGGVSLSGDGGAFVATLPIYARAGVQLGELCPTLKCKVVEGTLSSTAGTRSSFPHGIGAAATILGVLPRVNASTITMTPPNNFFSDSQYALVWDSTNLHVNTTASASSAMLGRPVSFLVFYLG